MATRSTWSASDGGTAISSDRSGADTYSRTQRNGSPSTDENMPKPPPFQGLSSAVRASVICAAASATSSSAGNAIAARLDMGGSDSGVYLTTAT